MTNMVEQAIEIVGNNTFDAVFDKGYYTAEEIHKTQELGVIPIKFQNTLYIF